LRKTHFIRSTRACYGASYKKELKTKFEYMEITVKKSIDDFSFIASNGEKNIALAAGPKLSGENSSFRPMQLLLASLGGCMSIDIMMILKKQRQKVHNLEIKVIGDRVDGTPAYFNKIVIEVHVKGDVKEEKLQQAIRLSEEKYCSVYHSLRQDGEITTKYILNGY